MEHDKDYPTSITKPNGERVMQSEITEAFNKVEPKTHWKDPIDAVVKIEKVIDIWMVTEAIIYFTGSVPEVYDVDGDEDSVRFIAEGYYNAIGM